MLGARSTFRPRTPNISEPRWMIRPTSYFPWPAILVLAGLSAGCGGSPTATVRIDGSSTVYPISRAAAEEFGKANRGVKVTVGLSGTGGGFKQFIAGDIEICDASRPITDAEQTKLAEKGIEFVTFVIAYDGLSVIVNPANDWVDCLTVEQLKRLWEPDSTVKKWSDLDSNWPAENINLFGPGHDSGTFDFFTLAIVGKERSSRSDYAQSEDDNVISAGVSQDRFSLGYLGLAYYTANADKLKLLGVDGGQGCVKPSTETVLAKQYLPLSRPLYLYVRRDALAREEVRNFVRYYLDHAADFAREEGYVPVSPEEAARDRDVFQASLEASAASAASP